MCPKKPKDKSGKTNLNINIGQRHNIFFLLFLIPYKIIIINIEVKKINIITIKTIDEYKIKLSFINIVK